MSAKRVVVPRGWRVNFETESLESTGVLHGAYERQCCTHLTRTCCMRVVGNARTRTHLETRTEGCLRPWYTLRSAAGRTLCTPDYSDLTLNSTSVEALSFIFNTTGKNYLLAFLHVFRNTKLERTYGSFSFTLFPRPYYANILPVLQIE